ncbi:MAG: hypothetical protein Q7T49_00480 [bacterium]|nr:hypothetical protein [bacterium]
MRKVMMFLAVLALAQLAMSEDFVELKVVKGSTMSETYYAHPECQAVPYSVQYEQKFKVLNSLSDFTKMLPGTYKFPTTATEQVVVVVDSGIQEEDLVPRHEIALTTYDKLTAKDYARIDEQIKHDQYVTKLEADLATAQKRLVTEDQFRDSLIRRQEEQIKQLSAKLPPGQVFNHSDPDYIDGTSYPLSSSKSSFQSIIPIIPISTAYVIGSVGIIIFLSSLIGFLLLKVSQLKSDRLRQENNLEHIHRQMETEFAAQMKPIVAESNKRRRNAIYMRHLLEHDYYFFHYPGTVVKATRQPVEDIILPIEDRRPNGLALVRIAGIEELVPARPQMIEAALRSASHQNSDKAFILPPLEEQPPPTEKELVIEKPLTTHRSPIGITAAAS